LPYSLNEYIKSKIVSQGKLLCFQTIVALLQFGMMLICARGLQNPKPTRPVLKTLGVQRDFRCEAFTLFV
jgi:hypothetical protein